MWAHIARRVHQWCNQWSNPWCRPVLPEVGSNWHYRKLLTQRVVVVIPRVMVVARPTVANATHDMHTHHQQRWQQQRQQQQK